MHDVVIHLGHCFRTVGFTGTAGHRGSEQQFVSQLGEAMADLLQLRGYDAVTALADEALPRCNVFLALHQDGSTNPAAKGASVGYPPSHGPSQRFAQLWKAQYTIAGYPHGFRPDNYTRALRTYYGFRRVHADVMVLLEHGFATNRADADWMWDNLGLIAATNVAALAKWLGTPDVPVGPTEGGDDDMQIINDPERQRMFAGWVHDGTQHVREFADYRGAHVGDPMPGISYVIDEQVSAGTIVKVHL